MKGLTIEALLTAYGNEWMPVYEGLQLICFFLISNVPRFLTHSKSL